MGIIKRSLYLIINLLPFTILTVLLVWYQWDFYKDYLGVIVILGIMIHLLLYNLSSSMKQTNKIQEVSFNMMNHTIK